MVLTLDGQDRPLVRAFMSYLDLPPDFSGCYSVLITALIDSGADGMLHKDWPEAWPVGPSQVIRGVGVTTSKRSLAEVETVIVNRDGSLEKLALLVPLITKIPGSQLGQDFINSVGAHITNL